MISKYYLRYLIDVVTCWVRDHDPVRRVGPTWSGIQCARCGKWVS